MGDTTRARRTGAALTKSIGAVALAAVFIAVGSQRAEASPTLLFVNGGTGHDVGSCGSFVTACKTISYALTQAGASATIKVAGGTYNEQLAITQNVTIVGMSANVKIAPAAVAASNDTDPDNPSVPQYAIVDVHNSTSALTNVNLENLTVDGAAAGASSFNSCSNNFPGVYFHNASGSMINDKVVNVQMSQALFGCQTGAGLGVVVHSDTGDASNVVMKQVTVANYQKGGILCYDLGTTCTVERSVVTGIGPTSLTAQNGVQVWGTGSFTFSRNHVSKNTYTGGGVGNDATGMLIINAGAVNVVRNTISANDVGVYALEDAAFGLVAPAGTWTFSGNKLTSATDDAPPPFNVPGEGYGDGLDIDSTTNPVTIKGNRTSSNFEYGVALFGASGVKVSRNNGGHGNYDGIYVGGPGSAVAASTGNTINGNRAQFNRNDGILADVNAAESGNTFSANMLHHNTKFEAQDLSTGGGTKGTANTWTGNRCGSPHAASPVGIC